MLLVPSRVEPMRDDTEGQVIAPSFMTPELFGPLTPFVITEISYDPATDKTALTWNLKNNGIYSIDASTALELWAEVTGNVPSDGATTTVEPPSLLGEDPLFFQIRQTN